MITLRRSTDRGHADHGWLDTFHTFSFAGFHDADFMGFSHLRVLNQDRVAPAKGFSTHGHENMEIVSLVLEGTLEHKDSMGNGSSMTVGDVQLMSAGTGVTHSEFNGSEVDPVHFLQMWILPRELETPPRYEQKNFGTELDGGLRLVVSSDGRDGSVTIGQDVSMYAGRLAAGDDAELHLDARRCGWVHVASGEVELDGQQLKGGDGAAVRDLRELRLSATAPSVVVAWDLPEPDLAR